MLTTTPPPPASAFEITWEDRGSYLRARVSGAVDSVATSLAYWRAIHEEAKRRGAKYVLVVEAFQTPASLMEVFEVAGQIPSIIQDLVVAFVDERFEQFDENRFGEDVAVNRGATGKVFAKEEEAAAWLESIASAAK